MVALGGCYSGHDLASGYSRIGIEVSGASLIIRYLPCAGEELKIASMYELKGNNQVAPDAGDVVLWTIVGEDVALLQGSGVVPMMDGNAITLLPGAEYLVEVGTSLNLVDTFSFTIEDLVDGKVRVNESNTSEADFVKAARESC